MTTYLETDSHISNGIWKEGENNSQGGKEFHLLRHGEPIAYADDLSKLTENGIGESEAYGDFLFEERCLTYKGRGSVKISLYHSGIPRTIYSMQFAYLRLKERIDDSGMTNVEVASPSYLHWLNTIESRPLQAFFKDSRIPKELAHQIWVTQDPEELRRFEEITGVNNLQELKLLTPPPERIGAEVMSMIGIYDTAFATSLGDKHTGIDPDDLIIMAGATHEPSLTGVYAAERSSEKIPGFVDYMNPYIFQIGRKEPSMLVLFPDKQIEVPRGKYSGYRRIPEINKGELFSYIRQYLRGEGEIKKY